MVPVEVRGLVKRYGRVLAVDDVDLTVERGDVYGYLGPNGAGKTTTLRILLGLIRPDAGSVRLFGRDPVGEGARALDDVAGFVEEPAFYPYLSGRQNLELLGTLDGGSPAVRIDEVLELVGLPDRARDRLGGYSQGMRQRLGIAASLLRAPQLLILDEPANGLDPAGIRDMRALISGLAREGITVLYSSHLLGEVEEVCNRVAIVDHGRIVFEGRLDDLRQSFGEHHRVETGDPERALAVARASPGVGAERLEGGILRFEAESGDALDAFTVALGAAGVGIRSLTTERATLEDLFFRLTEGEPAEAAA
ncbi:MAG: ABC transporter ATP-binding protein [Actinobacteria bacterium]|nr:MAG: ABC transporter ATP-binding protein [Actinomycetota bacterium]